MKAKNALSLALAAGIASTAMANESETPMDYSDALIPTSQVKIGGHYYFNIITGEKILNVNNEAVRAAIDEGTEIWINETGLDFDGDTTPDIVPCAPQGATSGPGLALHDDPSLNYLPPTFSSIAIGSLAGDWGGIEADTVVDCVRIEWSSSFNDSTDTDGDTVIDPQIGFAGVWTFLDGFRGRVDANSTAAPILTFQFNRLPGNDVTADGDGDTIPDGPLPPGFLTIFTADIDLATTFASSVTFEIADTDSDLQGADLANLGYAAPGAEVDSGPTPGQPGVGDGIPDFDQDQDGLADFGWVTRYIQPGTEDTDNADSDSDTSTGVDGNVFNRALTGRLIGMPSPGTAVFNTASAAWEWQLDGPTARPTEDVFTFYPPANPLPFNLFFGGFSCDDTDPLTPGVQFAPWSDFAIRFFGPDAGGCAADFNGDGVASFPDVGLFLAAFAAMDPSADFNGDGSVSFPDVGLFLAAFTAGCP